jgi:hypothetical protein
MQNAQDKKIAELYTLLEQKTDELKAVKRALSKQDANKLDSDRMKSQIVTGVMVWKI